MKSQRDVIRGVASGRHRVTNLPLFLNIQAISNFTVYTPFWIKYFYHFIVELKFKFDFRTGIPKEYPFKL